MTIRSLGYATDLALLQYAGSRVEDRGDCLRIETPDNPHFWWGNFLLLPNVPAEADADAWIARHRSEFPGAQHVALGFDDPHGSVDDLAPFGARGLELAGLTVMTAQRTRPPRSQHAGAVNRRLHSDDDWEQSVRLRMRTDDNYDPVMHEPFVRARAVGYRRLVEAGRGAWFGAFLGDRLVAQLGLFGTGEGRARFQAVETDPDCRRQGLAGGLVHFASQWGLTEFGADTLVMLAEPDYVAIDLYRAVGFAGTEIQLQATRPAPNYVRG